MAVSSSLVPLRASRFLNAFVSQRSLFNIGSPRGFLNRKQPECVVKPCTELNKGLLDAAKQKPAVLILGFANSNERQRIKYAEAYTRLGIPAIHYNANCYWEGIPPIEDTMPFAPLFGGEKPGDLEPFVDRPFFIHLLSQNGTMGLVRLYRYLELHKKEHIWTENCKGVFFDCTPARFNEPRMGAFTYVLTRPAEGQTDFVESAKATFAKEVLLYLPMTIWNMKIRLVQWLHPERVADHIPFDYVKLKMEMPQTVFCFYSKTDHLVDPADTKELMDYNIEKGKDVTIWAAEAAPHILHVTRWKQKYVDFCQQFGRTVYARHFNDESLLTPEGMPSAPEKLKKGVVELFNDKEGDKAY